jgi:hypothetical protein
MEDTIVDEVDKLSNLLLKVRSQLLNDFYRNQIIVSSKITNDKPLHQPIPRGFAICNFSVTWPINFFFILTMLQNSFSQEVLIS